MIAMRRLAGVYRAEARVGVMGAFQYRTAAFFLLVGFLIEPVVYMVVWRSVAESAGSVGGYDVASFTAYYIVWTLVRAMNLARAPYSWDWWMQSGRISQEMIRPVNVFHRQLAWFGGVKLIYIMMWIPIAVGLSAVFRPELSPSLGQVAGFVVAIWGGYVVRFCILWVLGMISFWITRASAIFETVIVAELLLSGRLVPLSVMPAEVEAVASWLPFKWTFQFPIEVLIGRLSADEIWVGLGLQIAWIVGLGALIAVVWRRGTRRYEAVGS